MQEENKCKQEISYVMIKPGFEKCLPEIISRIHGVGGVCVKASKLQLSKEQVEEHYAHVPEKFRGEVVNYMISEPVIALEFAGTTGLVERIRKIVGSTKNAEAGTIRGDLGIGSVTCNVIHASDSVENAVIECKRFFGNEAKLNVCPLTEALYSEQTEKAIEQNLEF